MGPNLAISSRVCNGTYTKRVPLVGYILSWNKIGWGIFCKMHTLSRKGTIGVYPSNGELPVFWSEFTFLSMKICLPV